MRKVIALALSFAVQAAALSAPLVHAHPDDHATEHHAARAVHAHWDGHARPHRSASDLILHPVEHDRAVFSNPFVAVAASWLPTLGPVPGVFELSVALETRAHQPVEIVRSHDPPVFGSLSSRAPPASHT